MVADIYNNKAISMKSLSRSNATVDTHPPVPSPHNCPSCRCRSTDLSLRLNHSLSQPFLAHRQMEPNLYLSNHLSEPASERTPRALFRSTVFHQPPSKITFNAVAVSPKQTNVSFSYTSPPKARQAHSSEARFSTRRFKDIHFPQISREDDTVPVRKVVKGRKEAKGQTTSPYYEVFSNEKTPEKHRVLKMKKQRSKQKLQITLSKKSSSSKSIEQAEFGERGDPQDDYQFEAPRQTPINALWTSDRTQRSLKQDDLQRILNRQLPPASIEHIQEAQNQPSRKVIQLINNPTPPPSQHQLFTSAAQSHREGSSYKKYPTVQSIDAYEARIYVEKMSEQMRAGLSQGQSEETSLRFLRESQHGSHSGEAQLARSISEELSLHYDYYYPQEESDRSLSLHVAL